MAKKTCWNGHHPALWGSTGKAAWNGAMRRGLTPPPVIFVGAGAHCRTYTIAVTYNDIALENNMKIYHVVMLMVFTRKIEGGFPYQRVNWMGDQLFGQSMLMFSWGGIFESFTNKNRILYVFCWEVTWGLEPMCFPLVPCVSLSFCGFACLLRK